MSELEDELLRMIRLYKNRLNALDKGECIDSENYTKHLYWNRGYIEGYIAALERVIEKNK